MPMTTMGVFRQVVDAAVRSAFDTSLTAQSSVLYADKVGLGEDEVDVPEAQISSLSGVGRGALTVQLQQYGENSRYRGYPMTLVLNKYTSKLEYSEEDVHWIAKQSSSKFKTTINNAANNHVFAMYQNMNEDLAKMFYLGFGTTFLTGGNSEALFAAHTIRKTGTTQRNTFATGDTQRPFGPDGLSDAIVILNRLRDHNDIEMLPVRRARVLCSKELAPDVQRTLMSDYGPDNAHLGYNKSSKTMLAGRGIQMDYMVLNDITAAYQNYWFLVDLDRMEMDAKLAIGWRPRLADDENPSKGSLLSLASVLFGFYWTRATWCFGSQGNNATI